MKKLILAVAIAITVFAGGCASRPSRASDLYNGCIFTVKNGDITTYGVYIEVKERVRDYSVLNLRTYDEEFVNDVMEYQADPSRIYYRNNTIYNACHKEGYGTKSYFMTATQPLYKIPEDAYKKLVSRLSSATIEVRLEDSSTSNTYTFDTILPVVETAENYDS